MAEIKDETKYEHRDVKEWTLMFYFASDNPLAPGIVSQLKTLKNAGYHPEANVLAYFDPHPVGTPAHIFDVNAVYKLGKSEPDIGFASNDPFVRNLMEDRLWGEEKSRNGKTTIRELLIKRLKKKGLTYAPPLLSEDPAEAEHDENSGPGPEKSLRRFLDLCVGKYPAKHYMLFILGHGLIVGDDVFLFDEHAAKHSLSLRDLGGALRDFKRDIRQKIRGAEFELVSFHSCSMSSLELAFELQGTANNMLASQGPAFVGSWPYRQILIKVFNELGKKPKFNTKIKIPEMLKTIFDFVYSNSLDYLLAGYSFDLCLCDLSKSKVTSVEKPIKYLSDALVEGLKNVGNPFVKHCILLAHWESQSYWQENYTDLYDFCFRLDSHCKECGDKTGDRSPFIDIQDACNGVMEVLAKQASERPNNPVIKARFAGPDSQYSHGLSVFFPWTRPTADKAIVKKDKKHKNRTEYEQYKYNKTGWFRFLKQYWGPQELNRPIAASTMRASHKDEPDPRVILRKESDGSKLFEDMACVMFNPEGPLSNVSALNGGTKTSPPDPTGDECACGSIKNYFRDTRSRKKRGKGATEKPTFPVTQTFFAD